MQKRFRLFAALLACSLLLTACGKNESSAPSENVFADYQTGDNAADSAQSIAISAGVQDNDSMRFTYSGEPVAINYGFNASDDCEVGLLIFLDGVLQSYQVDGQTTAMHTLDLKADAEQIFTLYLTPSLGEEGGTLRLNFVNVFDPTLKTAPADGTVVFGNAHKFSQSMPWSLQMQAPANSAAPKIADGEKLVPMTDAQIQSYLETDSRGNTRDTRDTFQFELLAGGENMAPLYTLQEQNEMELRLYANTAQTYRVCLLADFTTLLPINGAQYVDVEVQKDSYSVIDLSFDRSELEPYTNLFAVAVALSTDDGVYKTSSVCLVK